MSIALSAIVLTLFYIFITHTTLSQLDTQHSRAHILGLSDNMSLIQFAIFFFRFIFVITFLSFVIHKQILLLTVRPYFLSVRPQQPLTFRFQFPEGTNCDKERCCCDARCEFAEEHPLVH